jgi:uncharacterized protein involved in exopolysaccharide biosynthesis
MTLLEPAVLEKSYLAPGRWGRYALVSLSANTLIWGIALGYLHFAPTKYTCEWSLILPGAGAGSSLNIADIGSVDSLVSSPFGSNSAIDPRSNYKAIAESYTVLARAAKSLKLSVSQFGKPRIKIVDQTSVLEFSIEAPTPEQARKKALALNTALEERIDSLRLNEVHLRQKGFGNAIASAKERLNQAQKKLLAYKTRAGIVSTDELKSLVTAVGELRRSRIELLGQQARSDRRLGQLTQNLGLNSQQAAGAFMLQGDPIFQQYLKDYSEATSVLVIDRSKWGENHPQVIKEIARQNSTHAALLKRASALTGRAMDEVTLQKLNLSSIGISGTNRAALFQDLVSSQAEATGIGGQVTEITEQLGGIEGQLKDLAKKEFVLEGLQRNLQVTEAIFSSTLAKIDVGKTDIFASYPLVQMLLEPGLPDAPSSPKKNFVLLGTLLASALVTTGLTLLWIRKKKELSA